MKKLFALLLAVALVFTLVACSPPEEKEDVYRLWYSSELSSLNYLLSGNQADQVVGANCVDTLVEYDNYGAIQPSLATEWHTDDNITWTFKLRQGVMWYDHQGNEIAEVTAQDFVDAMKYTLTSDYGSGNTYPLRLFIKNATQYRNGDIGDFSQVGIKAVDKYTIEYTLTSAAPYFISALTYVCYMPAYGPQLEELGKDFGTANDKMYYCGAYILSVYEPQVQQVYTKNENYWDADKVYIERIEKRYNAESSTLAPEAILRNEIDFCELPTDIVDDWLKNHAEYVSLARQTLDYSYFYCFNFDPKFDAKYEPDNWRIAVNNENFRKAIMTAFNREYTMTALVPGETASLINSSVTPPGFVPNEDNVDFSTLVQQAGALEFFDAAKAASYKAAAMTELAAAGATFPIIVYVRYNPSGTDWENECVLLEQQIESVLGTDFIDIVVEAGPSESFLSQIRRNGNYGFLKCNWGADYNDPATFCDPFAEGNNYNFMDLTMTNEYTEDDDVAALMREYYALVAAVQGDTNARYAALAKAEAFLIEHAIVIPYYTSIADYQATKLNVYESQYAPCGVSVLRYKGMHLLDAFVSMDKLEENRLAYENQR